MLVVYGERPSDARLHEPVACDYAIGMAGCTGVARLAQQVARM